MSEELEGILGTIPTCIAQSDTSETEEGSNAVLRDVEDEFRRIEARADFQMSINRIENPTPTGEFEMNNQPMLLDFPKMYLQEIEGLLWP